MMLFVVVGRSVTMMTTGGIEDGMHPGEDMQVCRTDAGNKKSRDHEDSCEPEHLKE